MEYIFTNLPQYVKLNSRSEFSSSVVSSGAVLLFSEDGYTLTGKLPDGTFITIGGSGTDVSDTTAGAANVQSGYYFYTSAGVRTEGTLTTSGGTDVSDTTATGGTVLTGYDFYNSAGVKTSGTIPTVSAYRSGYLELDIVVPSGYIATQQNFNNVDLFVSALGSTTAEAGDVLSGKVFYNSGGILTTGMIPTVTATLAANVTTVPSGYIASSQTLTVPLASSATVAGGIVTIPAGYVASDYTVSAGGVGSTDYFKCATVTSGGSTWTGYKAVWSSGKYEYASSATSGLTYTTVTPVVGQTYTDGALVRAFLYEGIPLNGLVFYAPLSSYAAEAQTEQALIYAGNYSFGTYQGIQAMNLQSGCVSVSAVAQSGLDNGFALSMWICNANWNATSVIAHMGSWDGSYQQWWGMQSDNGASKLYYQPGISAGSHTNLQADTWYHVVYQISNGVAKAWINGVEDLNAELEFSAVECSGKPLYLGSIGGDPSSYPFNGYIAAVRIYNRALSDAEIAALAAEFTPSVS